MSKDRATTDAAIEELKAANKRVRDRIQNTKDEVMAMVHEEVDVLELAMDMVILEARLKVEKGKVTEKLEIKADKMLVAMLSLDLAHNTARMETIDKHLIECRKQKNRD